jgi:hypothetical protein
MKWLRRIFGKEDESKGSTDFWNNLDPRSKAACGVCGDESGLRTGERDLVICHTCHQEYGAGISWTDAENCPGCGYAYLPNLAPWHIDSSEPKCQVCGGSLNVGEQTHDTQRPSPDPIFVDDTSGNSVAKHFWEAAVRDTVKEMSQSEGEGDRSRRSESRSYSSVCADCSQPDPNGMYQQRPSGRRRCRACAAELGPLMED